MNTSQCSSIWRCILIWQRFVCLTIQTDKVAAWTDRDVQVFIRENVARVMTLWRHYCVQKFDANLLWEHQCKKNDFLRVYRCLSGLLGGIAFKHARILITDVCFTAFTITGCLGRWPRIQRTSYTIRTCVLHYSCINNNLYAVYFIVKWTKKG